MERKKEKPHINVDYFEDLTGAISDSEPESVAEIGSRIKELREAKGISLTELSNMTGFDVDLLSDIENKEVQPQLGTVMKLSKALDSAFSRLVSGVGKNIYSITRKNERKSIARSTSRKGRKKLYSYQSLAPEVKGRHMEALMVKLEENPDPEISVHDGEEFIYVVDGTVDVVIGDDRFELEPGDSVYYLSTTPHIISAKKGSASILAVLYGG
ncbi:MAG: helix-turn-helix domain-containing protein [Desulfobacterales bacterium]|nr:helix-turn-helix domain-containing protein [Desulfobacterales bacterium]